MHDVLSNVPTKLTDAERIVDCIRLRLERRRDFLKECSNDDAETEAAWNNAHPDPNLDILDESLKLSAGSTRLALAKTFGLNDTELALLDFCVAISAEPALEALVRTLQGVPERPVPTEALARRLFDLAPGRIWRPTSALSKWRLIEEVRDPTGAASGFKADPRIVDWYFGLASLDAELVGICSIPSEQVNLPDWDISNHVAILKQMQNGQHAQRVMIIGASGSGRSDLACLICKFLLTKPLWVLGALIPQDQINEAYIRIQRFAILTGRTPVWRSTPAHWPEHLECGSLQFILRSSGAFPPASGCVDYEISQPVLSPALRHSFWTALTGQSDLPIALQSAKIAELRDAVNLAEKDNTLMSYFLRNRALSDLTSIGRVLEPSVDWNDLVLSPEILTDLQSYAFEARTQRLLVSNPEIYRLYRKDCAPTALFTGPPGVGKTMAAECIAADLELPLLVIDVAQTVSKYIGETAKNLSKVFAQARRFGCILFFDEADAYFSKRTDLKDSQDRHANADTNHLLQLIEEYEGFVILSTNKKANIDEAFFRRIRHAIDFHKPTLIERQKLWARFANLLFDTKDVARLNTVFIRCAKQFELSPAQIKSAVLNSYYANKKTDGPVTEEQILYGLARELRKEGRALNPELASLLILKPERETPNVA